MDFSTISDSANRIGQWQRKVFTELRTLTGFSWLNMVIFT